MATVTQMSGCQYREYLPHTTRQQRFIDRKSGSPKLNKLCFLFPLAVSIRADGFGLILQVLRSLIFLLLLLSWLLKLTLNWIACFNLDEE